MSIISVPEEYWLKVEKFNIYNWGIDEVRVIHTMPNVLIQDFYDTFYDFDKVCEEIFKRHKEGKPIKKAKVHTPYIKKDTPNLIKAISTDISNNISNKKPPKYKETINYTQNLDVFQKIIPKKYRKDINSSLPAPCYMVRD